MTATNPEKDELDLEAVGRFPMTSRIFAINGVFPTLRACLLKRGWIEKKHRFHFCTKTEPYMWPFRYDLVRKSESKGINKNQNANKISSEECPETKLQIDIIKMSSHLLKYYPPTFIWASRKDAILYNYLHKNQIVNHFSHSGFTTKAALSSVIRNVKWTCDMDPDKFFPRCFCLANQVERDAFIENFRLTACFNVVKWLIKKATVWHSTTNDKECIMIPERVIKFVLVQCLVFLSTKNHDDIEEMSEEITCSETDWDWFLEWTYHLKDENYKFSEWKKYLPEFHKIAEAIQKVWPQWKIDGYRNVWIIKPAAKSQGQGIKISENLNEIMGLVGSYHDNHYVVQKYIEHPLLIGGVKFDIRQWFLVTDYNPLTMWMYCDSYLRFCSMPFTLDCKDVSIHLCNNSIQCNYLRSVNRLSTLPEGNMMTNEEFKKLLASQGHPDAWNNTIYPGMRSAIISILHGSQEQMVGRNNRFELYGADFMIDEQLHPWLIEINASPCLAPSTPVTRLLCANVIDDTLKIVLDRRVNNKCSIGHFELGYQGDVVPWTEFSDRTLVLTGKKIEKPIRNSTELSVSSNLMTNKSTVKEGKSKFEEEVYCAKLILWCASNLYRNIQNYKFKNSYVDKIVNDIKNCEKYNYYSVCNGSIPAKTHYIVPQHFGNSKNKNKSFTIFEKANIRIVMTENV
ncbi:tubulin monoglycylase TTLL3-like [Centruroides sculpturatus]|uniref:tubulin monoglycylase TTLL3-like n=1 Tax=Centruroides sculpturatus TaxID=218467 RepID=UPI000C6C8FB3|nr:tubulin monoglycylase TTLL3-like [Centruroides sculpturatus]